MSCRNEFTLKTLADFKINLNSCISIDQSSQMKFSFMSIHRYSHHSCYHEMKSNMKRNPFHRHHHFSIFFFSLSSRLSFSVIAQSSTTQTESERCKNCLTSTYDCKMFAINFSRSDQNYPTLDAFLSSCYFFSSRQTCFSSHRSRTMTRIEARGFPRT